MRPLIAEPRYPQQPGAEKFGAQKSGAQKFGAQKFGAQKNGAPKPAPAAKPQKPPRRTVAPTRLSFRLERLWLTPLVRVVTRVGLPVFCVTLGLGLWLGNDDRRADLVEWSQDLRLQIENRPEFQLSSLAIEGASPEVEGAVHALLPVRLPASRFALDLDGYRAALLRLDAVKTVALVVQPGGTLSVRVTEREPVILWRTALGLQMLDESGHRTASLTRRDARPDLPLIAGEGADRAVPEALAILAAAKPILPRARGLIRIGERRWDIVLDKDRRILLPEKDPVQAIDRALALNAAEDLLSRDFSRLDLRNATRPTIRLSAPALVALQQAAAQTTSGASP